MTSGCSVTHSSSSFHTRLGRRHFLNCPAGVWEAKVRVLLIPSGSGLTGKPVPERPHQAHIAFSEGAWPSMTP